MSERKKIGILISGTGSNMKALVAACESGRVNADVVFVGSDRRKAPGLSWAAEHGLNVFTFDHSSVYRNGVIEAEFNEEISRLAQRALWDLDGRELVKKYFYLETTKNITKRLAHEVMLLREIERHPFDLLCLAGYMRLMTPYFIEQVSPDRLAPRIMNIHPSLLPAFPGTDGYGDTLAYGCKVGGCTVHFVDFGEDTGPVIGQRSFVIEPDDGLEAVRRKGLALEHELYPECVELFVRGRLKVQERQQKNSKSRRMVCVTK